MTCGFVAALLTSRSSVPNASIVLATALWRCSASADEPATAMARGPASRALRASSRPACLRLVRQTLPPRVSTRRAMASPIPRDPPVIRAVLLSRIDVCIHPTTGRNVLPALHAGSSDVIFTQRTRPRMSWDLMQPVSPQPRANRKRPVEKSCPKAALAGHRGLQVEFLEENRHSGRFHGIRGVQGITI